jgi:hypothetical protein
LEVLVESDLRNQPAFKGFREAVVSVRRRRRRRRRSHGGHYVWL